MRLVRPAAVIALSAALAGCSSLSVPSFGAGTARASGAQTSGAQVASSTVPVAVIVGESGLAVGIPAAVQVFPDPDAPVAARPVPDRLPTMFPRQLPHADDSGTAFADRVSISPDGRRLLIGTQQGSDFELQVVGVNRKDVETRQTIRGEFAFAGWAGPRTALVGYRRGGDLRVETLDLARGDRRALPGRLGENGGVLANRDGRVVTTGPGRDGFVCADGQALPTAYEGAPIVQAGPLDPDGRIVFRTTPDAGRGVLAPYDCAGSAFGTPIYEGAAFDGALFDAGSAGYIGVWDEAGPRYADPSLAFEMTEVASSFPGEVTVWPIEFARSPNTVLLYVSGPDVAPSYYVLDRYAGALDLHVTYARPE